jgi:hypothetical protein
LTQFSKHNIPFAFLLSSAPKILKVDRDKIVGQEVIRPEIVDDERCEGEQNSEVNKNGTLPGRLGRPDPAADFLVGGIRA